MSGAEQSPIDLTPAIDADLEPPALNWREGKVEISNFRDELDVEFEQGGSLELDGISYRLTGLHFHQPSEHLVDGHAYPIEAHFVHRASDGRLAVVAVFFDRGKVCPAFAALSDAVPAVGDHAASAHFDPAQLLPKGGDYFRYEGSQTTPPYSEIVSWIVFREPVEASAERVERFTRQHAMSARPVQNRNRRFVLAGRGAGAGTDDGG